MANSRQSTPRRRKVWAQTHDFQNVLAVSAFADFKTDLLSQYKTDMGLLESQGVTVMRIVGSISIGWLSTATTTVPFQVWWGIAWVPNNIISAGGVANPDPSETGSREIPWIQRGALRAQTISGKQALGSAEGQMESYIRLDCKQMRKQPSPNYTLSLMIHNFASADEDATISYDLATMLALP